MFLITDENRVPVCDRDGRPVEGITAEEAAAWLTKYPEGRIVDAETGQFVDPPWHGPSSSGAIRAA